MDETRTEEGVFDFTWLDEVIDRLYAHYPGVLMRHGSNEYNVGDCHCPLCCENFRKMA